MAISILGLDDAVQALILLSSNYSQLSPKDSATLYLAGLAILCHLKTDTQKIHKSIQEHGQQAKMLPTHEIPAMSAVLQNAQLFRALLSCLQVGPPEQSEINNDSTNLSRKRTLSIGEQGPSKAVKLSNSPVPTMGGRIKASSGETNGQNFPKPALSLPALAAAILYGALRPIDHWPAPLVNVYCDDCFGGRKWVDMPECSPLVCNLALVHSAPEKESEDESSLILDDADQVAAAYRGFLDVDRSGDGLSASGVPHRRGSVSSTGSNTFDQQPSDRANNRDTVDSGSSSGEEDDDDVDEVVLNARDLPQPRVESCYPLQQRRPNLDHVRQRYFGSNRSAAHSLLVDSLSNRLASKVKQSSGLLVALPSFLVVPKVRQITAENLERWLQSPALAGLSRNLFYSIVKNMKNVDPPLPEDLAAVESLVAMQLKANQLNTHIENIVAVAKGVPNTSVVIRMYSKLICNLVDRAEWVDLGSSDELKMIVAIHRAVSPVISYDCLAAAMLNRLAQEECISTATRCSGRRVQLVGRLRALIRTLGKEIASFDGCALLDAFYAYKIDERSWSANDEEDRGRLMFQCMPVAAKFGPMREAVYLKAKKVILTWCCKNYGTGYTYNGHGHMQHLDLGTKHEGAQIVPAPDYRCIFNSSDKDREVPTWLRTMRCMLFMEDPGSHDMEVFNTPGSIDNDDHEDWAAIRACCESFRPVDDEMIWIVLRSSVSAGGDLSDSAAIQLIEVMFENASKKELSLQLEDPMIVWEIYNLTTYRPSSFGIAEDSEMPQIAISSLWWRVTILALIMCASSAEKIGALIWKESPTLRCLIKMIISNRFRFPTIDCDEDARFETKAGEQQSRDLESANAEKLFLPPVRKSGSTKEKLVGSRVSTRLRKRDSEARLAREMAEKRQRKSLLRAAQKAIMLWDPSGPARKPPKEAAELVLAVERIFTLSVALQSSTNPDFLLMTLGGTSRGSIERACDWLLPIIAKIPTAITRLPSSASCFLLLRAYGTDGHTELKLLSAPLLSHVESCLKGAFGSSEAVEALHLLMQDLASAEPEKRRCARRVLQASLASLTYATTNEADSWLLSILSLEHVTLVLQESIQLMASAAALERGKNLLALALALEHFVSFACDKSLDPVVHLPDLAIELIRTRPGVVAEAMDSHIELRSWFLRMITAEFEQRVRVSPSINVDEQQQIVRMKFSSSQADVSIPLRVLEGTSALISIWADVYNKENETDYISIQRIIGDLLNCRGHQDESDVTGLSSAVILSAGRPKVPVDMWIMLAKARSDTIARLAALATPLPFLPRLLLSTGLPAASLIVMIDRLGRLGDASVKKDKVYLQLLDSLTINKGTAETPSGLTTKLHVRLAAYTRLGLSTGGNTVPSTTFLSWLSSHCSSLCESNKSKRIKTKAVPLQKTAVQPQRTSLIVGASLLAEIDCASVAADRTFQHFAWKGVDESPYDRTPYMPSPSATASEKVSLVNPGECLKESAFDSTTHAGSAAKIAKLLQLSASSDEHDISSMLKWIPLYLHTITPGILTKLFMLTGTPRVDEILDLLAKKCSVYWDSTLIRSSLEWLASNSPQGIQPCRGRVLHFTAACLCSEKWLPPMHSFSFTPKVGPLSAGHHVLDRLTNLAVPGAHEATGQDETQWQVLYFQLRRHGSGILDPMLSRISELSDSCQRALITYLLRVYVCCPSWVQANDPSMQDLLLRAVDFNPDFVKWSTPISDILLNNGLHTLASTGDIRSCRGLNEAARQYPLIVVGAIPRMVQVLRFDATEGLCCSSLDGRVQAEGIKESQAFLDNRIVLVKSRHWGYAFTEGVWLGMIDVLLSLPRGVLFPRSLAFGLFDLLSTYLLLLSVQNGLHPPNCAIRVKAKLTELLHSLKGYSLPIWSSWLDTSIEGRAIRHILMGLEILSPQEAIASLPAGDARALPNAD